MVEYLSSLMSKSLLKILRLSKISSFRGHQKEGDGTLVESVHIAYIQMPLAIFFFWKSRSKYFYTLYDCPYDEPHFMFKLFIKFYKSVNEQWLSTST